MVCLSKTGVKRLLLPLVLVGHATKNALADTDDIKDARAEGVSRGARQAVGNPRCISLVAGVQVQRDWGCGLALYSAFPSHVGFSERDFSSHQTSSHCIREIFFSDKL